MVDQFKQFLDMEIRYHLFDLTDKKGFPCWDFVRVDIYNYKLANVYSNILSPHKHQSFANKIKKVFFFIIKGLNLMKGKCTYLFIYCPRFYDSNNFMYDRVAEGLISYTNQKNCVYLNTSNNYERIRDNDTSLFLFDLMARLKTIGYKIDNSVYSQFRKAIKDTFGIDVSYKYVNKLFRHNVKEYYAYSYCLKHFKPKKIFVSRDKKKGLYWAAKIQNIPTYELQHGTLIFDYPSYSYPSGIDYKSNIAFADYFVKPGDGWGERNNLPVRNIYILGNDNFISAGSDNNKFEKDIILVVSSDIHAKYLRPLAKEIAMKTGMRVVYRLHPQEYKDLDDIRQYFEDVSSLITLDMKSNMQDLVRNSILVITIASTVYFEAKSLGKRVAVLRRDNYYLLKDYVLSSENSCFLNNADDVLRALEMPENVESVKYYKPFDYDVAKQIVK